MEQPNPYAKPQAEIHAEEIEQATEIKVFSFRGRLGRLRYLCYLGISGILLAVLSGLSTVLMGLGGTALMATSGILVAVFALVSFVLAIMWTVRRVHDIDLNGWFSILFLLPLINFALWFIPGSNGTNRFGLKTPNNHAGIVIGAIGLPIVFVTGILAAIAIPAYSDYTARAKVYEGVALSVPARTSVAIACSEGALAPDMGHEALDLNAPESYSGDVVSSVTAYVLDSGVVEVEIVLKGFGYGVEEGDVIVYQSRCEGNNMSQWEVDGTVPRKLLPKI